MCLNYLARVYQGLHVKQANKKQKKHMYRNSLYVQPSFYTAISILQVYKLSVKWNSKCLLINYWFIRLTLQTFSDSFRVNQSYFNKSCIKCYWYLIKETTWRNSFYYWPSQVTSHINTCNCIYQNIVATAYIVIHVASKLIVNERKDNN